jgi:hypothetical protein
MVHRHSDRDEGGELRGPWRWLAGAVAALLAAGVVGGLVFHRLSSPSPSGNSAGSAAVSGVDLNCRLPVLADAAGAFITFPNGAITIDRSVKIDPYSGSYTYTYDAEVGRWVPVPRPAISPDGRSYAYLAETSGVPGATTLVSLHTHEIASRKDRVLWEATGSPMGPGPNTLAWLSDGIYFSSVLVPVGGAKTTPLPAVYVSDPDHAGPPRRLGPNPPPQMPSPGQSYAGPDLFMFFGGGAAWATGNRVPKQAPSPNNPPSPGELGPDRVLRMDLRDGSVSTWFKVSGTDLVSVMGLDGQERPILAFLQLSLKAEPQPGVFVPPVARLQLLTGPNQAVDISAGNPDFHMGSMPSADSHGIWFGSWNSVWLYTDKVGLRQVASIPAGLFPSPSPPPGLQGKGGAPNSPPPGMPAYMQGTLVTPAGSCT